VRSVSSSPKRPAEPRVRLRVLDARAEPPARGNGLIAALERPFLAAERWVERTMPAASSPLAQTGAIANTALLIAVVSGVLLLFWYVPSVRQAYGSLQAMSPRAEGLVRSIHRYSSDGCMLFIVLHALRCFAGRRFAGPRWLAWVTGLASLGILWIVGWTGYWLVWDERGQQVALGTARLLDELPIFIDPLSRSFLTDGSVNSFLFFVVFFVHMLLPLLIAVGLWLHITRLSRPRFLADRKMTLWIVGSLVIVSLVWPATSAGPARMIAPPDGFTMDWWYLAPLALTDRLGSGMLWAILLGGGAVLYSLPWWGARGRAKPAVVEAAKCNDCRKCFVDCPYGAIEMVPRTDGRRFEREARVDPSKCVGCGICAGSCDSSGIGVPWLTAPDVRKNMDRFLKQVTAGATDAPFIAFACADSAAAGLRIDPETGECDALPGYRVWAVPCAAWVHPLTVERALRHGAGGVLVVACRESGCGYREGTRTLDERLAGKREPSLRLDHVDPTRVLVLHLDRGERAELARAAERFRKERRAPTAPPLRRRGRTVAAGIFLAAAFGAATTVASDLPYRTPATGEPQLVVSFKHPGATGERCRELSEEEKRARPVHMRQDRVCERGRAAVRLRVRIDGEVVHEHAYAPGGLFGDESSIAVYRRPVRAGEHRVALEIGDTGDAAEWTYRDERVLRFRSGQNRVVLFDRSAHFTWE
jgi:coenzyme F420-reducing hydrogenase delta subunit/Pyruvate/2-oxoacid:ferredoxin oxidoreductase delta subunit